MVVGSVQVIAATNSRMDKAFDSRFGNVSHMVLSASDLLVH